MSPEARATARRKNLSLDQASKICELLGNGDDVDPKTCSELLILKMDLLWVISSVLAPWCYFCSSQVDINFLWIYDSFSFKLSADTLLLCYYSQKLITKFKGIADTTLIKDDSSKSPAEEETDWVQATHLNELSQRIFTLRNRDLLTAS